jgi:drug/metabolite transporter superfamily protein YnfA
VTERVSTTRRDLIRLRLGLLGLTVVVLALSVWSFGSTQSTLSTVRDQTAPAVLDVASARAALTQAHSAAVSSFVHGGATLVGPGEQYTTDLAVAEQDLARAAGDNAGGSTGSSALQLIAGLLTTYSDWMSQAGTHYRVDPSDSLYLTDLWYAARSLYGDDQTMDQLDALADAQRKELDAQLSDGWLDPPTVLAWLVPCLALLALLVHTQLYLWRKFGRRFNVGLLGATALLLVLIAATSSEFVLAGRAHAATAALTTYVTSADRQSQTVSDQAEHDLIEQVHASCGQNCGNTLPAVPKAVSLTAPAPPAASAAQATTQYADATDLGWLLVAIPVLALGIAALGLVGLQPRIDEYRYRS